MTVTTRSNNALAAGPPAEALLFRRDLRIYAPRDEASDRRYTIYDPDSDLSYFLGRNELAVARLFDGTRSIDDVAAILNSEGQRHISPDKLAAFSKRLVHLGLMAPPGVAAHRPVRDPATGISYGPLKSMLMIPLVRMQPDRLLDTLYRQFTWLCSPMFVYLGLGAIVAAMIVVVSRFDAFLRDVLLVYGRGLGWLLWHYPVIAVSIAVHELGHALACRAYKVRITDFGIAIYLLMATGWARPLQGDWTSLPLRERLVTIVMGPYASLLFAAAGVAFWAAGEPADAWHTFGVVMATSSTLALVPTLLPIFNGDTYLAIKECIGVPRLRQRAFQYVRETLLCKSRSEQPAPRRKALYWMTACGTLFGWALAWAWLLSLAWKFLPV